MAGPALNHTEERKAQTSNGGLILLILLAVMSACTWGLIDAIATAEAGGDPAARIILYLVLLVVARVRVRRLLLAAAQRGGRHHPLRQLQGHRPHAGPAVGLPWYGRKKICLRVRNVTGEKLKVNDKRGNPIEIAAVVVWRVTDTAQALFDVDAYQTFVDIQIETAVREIASHFAYDHAQHGEPTLRGDADQVSHLLREKLQDRVVRRGRRGRRNQAVTTSPTRRKSPAPCCGVSKPKPCSPRAATSCKARSRWCSTRWNS